MESQQYDQLDFEEEMRVDSQKILREAKAIKEKGGRTDAEALGKAFDQFHLRFDDPRFPFATLLHEWKSEHRVARKNARAEKLNEKKPEKGEWDHIPDVDKHPRSKEIKDIQNQRKDAF